MKLQAVCVDGPCKGQKVTFEYIDWTDERYPWHGDTVKVAKRTYMKALPPGNLSEETQPISTCQYKINMFFVSQTSPWPVKIELKYVKTLEERKTELHGVMMKIVGRLERRTKDPQMQSLEAMKEDLWRSQVEIEEVLK
jgi:hypothetical protein